MNTKTSANEQFRRQAGCIFAYTFSGFASFAPVRAFVNPRPNAKLPPRWAKCLGLCQVNVFCLTVTWNGV